MQNKDKKDLCLKILSSQCSNDVVEILKEFNLWDDPKLWRNYGDKEGSWGTINNQGNPAFALTEKITNSIDAVLMNKCWESNNNPKSESKDIPENPIQAIHKYFETKEELKKYDAAKNEFEDDLTDIAGLQEYWNDKKAREISTDSVCVSVGGNKKNIRYPIIAIADSGEGQTPEKLPTTIMSLHVGNKKSVKFAQGKWNQGGSGAILHCGQDSGIALQFVLTKRNPKILKNFHDQETEYSNRWSFTILRRNKPPRGSSNVSEAVFLCPELTQDNVYLPLSFESDTMPIMPSNDGQFSRQKKHGTVVVLFEYKLATSQVIRGKDSLYRQLDIQLPKLPLPVRIYEHREKFDSEKNQSLTMRGFSNFQINQMLKGKSESNLEDISPRRGFLKVDDYKISYDIFCFKKGKGDTYIPKSSALLWTVNGQTHAISPRDIFRVDKLSFNAIQKDLLIVIDCSDITGGDREDFFKSSRDRLATDFHLYKKIRESLIDDLSNHQALKNLIEKRIDENIEEDEIDDEETLDTIQQLLKDLTEEERKFLPPGLKLKQKKEVQKDSGKFNLPKKKFPTFFCFEELKNKQNQKQEISKDVEIDKHLSLRLFTDAELDYFERNLSPGRILLYWNHKDKNEEPKSIIGPNLQEHGLCTIRKISLPENSKAGDSFNLIINIKDKENKLGFNLSCDVLVKPKQIEKNIKKNANKNSKKNNKKNAPEGGQGFTIIEEVVQNPIIAQYVSKDKWSEICESEWNEEEVLHVIKRPGADGQKTFNLFLNKDNINLVQELKKSNAKYTPKIIETRYKMGISLIAMFSLLQYQKDKKNNRLTSFTSENSQSDENIIIDEEQTIKIATRNAGKGLFRLTSFIESIGQFKEKVNLSDISESD